MCNYYEETMPLFTNEEEYLKYYYDESLSISDKLNSIIKKGQPFQRQALLKNLLIYEKEPFFKSLINFIINNILTWDSETVLLLPKALYLLIINQNYFLENELFNTIFKHMITSISSGSEKNRNEYTFYFNKIIEFYSIVDIKNNNELRKNFFPYVINDDIIEFIVSLGIFGQTSANRKLCCFLSSSLCRIMVKINGEKNNSSETNIKKLYERLNYLFWDGEKIIEGQMVRELLYIIPIFKDIMFTNDDIIQAIKSYINHDTDHIIQVMAIISVLKNIIYLNEENNIVNILFEKIKEIIEDFDYESIYKNTILHILINVIYTNYLSLNPSFIYQIFKLGIMKNYYNYYKLDIFFIKNFNRYYFLINYFLDNAQYLESKYKLSKETNTSVTTNNDSESVDEYEILINQIQSNINFEEFFLKIYNELFSSNENNKNSNNNSELIENDTKMGKTEEIFSNDNGELSGCYFINNKNKDNFDSLIFDDYFFEENIDIIFNQKDSEKDLCINFYNKEIIKKITFLYLPKIISCFPNLKNNKILGDKLLALFSKNNIISVLDIYSSSLKYLEEKNENKNKSRNVLKKILKKHPLYELFLVLLKKNLTIFLTQGKNINKTKDNKEFFTLESNFYNKLILTILKNTNSIIQETPKLLTNDIYVLIGKLLNLLIPKFFKYYKNISYNQIINQNNNILGINSSFNNNKETIKVCYYEKIFDGIFNNFISKIIINNNLGHHIIKEYIEAIPFFILYSKHRMESYNFFKKEILHSDSFYKRKYSIIFYEKCFNIFSFSFIYKHNLYNDFLLLIKDKINLISTNAIELIYKYNKKIISYSQKLFQELCILLNEIYDLNIKAFNDKDKNNNLLFDREKNIIINKIISINNNINNYYSENEINQQKEYENKLISKENEIIKFSKLNNKNKSKNNINNNHTNYNDKNNNNENKKVNSNILQLSSISFQGKNNNNNNLNNANEGKFPTCILSNKNDSNIFSLNNSRERNNKNSWIEKSASGLFKEKKSKENNSKNNFILNSFNKDNKNIFNEVNNSHNGSRYNSNSKNIPYNKHYLPKIKELKINKKEYNILNNNIRSIDIALNKLNIKSDDNEEKNHNNKINKKEINIDIPTEKKIIKNDIRIMSFSHNRIPSAKIKIRNSCQIISDNTNIFNEKNNLYFNDLGDEKKTSSNNHPNIRYSCDFNNSKENNNNNFNGRSISNNHINMALISKNYRLKKENNGFNFSNNKIYIDASK